MSRLAGPSPASSSAGLRFSEKPRPGIQFTERMTGRIYPTETVDGVGAERGTHEGHAVELVLTVVIDDLECFLGDPSHEAAFVGTATASRLFGERERPAMTTGHVRLLAVDGDRVERRVMRYEGVMTSLDQGVYSFAGEKEIRNHPGFDLWRDTTRLLITVRRDSPGRERPSWRGTLTLSPDDFLRTLTTLRVIRADSLVERLDTLAEFGRFFAGVLLDSYGRLFARGRPVTPDPPRPQPRPPSQPARRQPDEVLYVETSDRARVRLTHYQGDPTRPVVLSPGFGMTSRCFAIDTIRPNLVEVLGDASYDVWLLDYRASPDLLAAGTSFTIDDIALRDYPAAVDKILELTRPSDGKVQMVVHCVGSMSFLMALLAGELKGQVRSAICSQLGLHPIAPTLSRIKAGLRLAAFFRLLGCRKLDADFDERKWADWAIDKALRLVPTEERCNNPACRRILFLFGESYRHDQLNTGTHDAMQEMFGVTSLRALQHLSLMLDRKHVVDKDGDNVYLREIKRLTIPIAFLHGEKNKEFCPESTLETYHLLRKTNPPHFYSHTLIPGFGHLDCFIGRDAPGVVFPWVLQQLERANAITRERSGRS